jgi:RHH-type proline utilization regulon transcriptional repressor/proline dehydrogenase/delta 1-pyrroline-5-carboxylate dehydrogenase
VNSFVNEPLLEIRRQPVRKTLLEALARLDRELPLDARAVVGGEKSGGRELASTDPGQPDRLVAESGTSDADLVARAIEAAGRGTFGWGRLPAAERVRVMRRAADGMRRERNRLAALIVRECGKPWGDADGEVCEAIDFVEYYAHQAITLDRAPDLVQVPGERNSIAYLPRGVVAVIAPWNFPLAISCGMVAAGLITGNSVLYKPAEQSPGVGSELVRILLEAGVDPDAISFLPGDDTPGRLLVEHPSVHTIAFTGSCAAGLEINAAAAKLVPGQTHIKRVVAEMGGKNCLVVDADADLDEVVPAAIESAFGFAGQKCSAASRILVHEALYAQLADRLAGAVSSALVGQAESFGIDTGPVIDAESVERHRRYLELGSSQGTLLASQTEIPVEGNFCPPVVLTGLPPDSELLTDEVFAPLVTLERVPSLEAAAAAIDSSSFALTGGLFTRNPDHARSFELASPVGNLYINRGITGAMVGRQPFGGNRLSGTGSKAGGPGYLSSFVEPRVTCENTMRHGLVV